MTEASLAGRVVAITGGARGIGRATARGMPGRRDERGDWRPRPGARPNRPRSRLGGGAIGLALDVTDRSSFGSFLDNVESDLGPLDVLVNNAGIMQLGPFVDEDDATTRRQLEINGMGVMYGMKEVIARMAPRRRGHIVNLASSAGKGGFAGAVTYCATKHFVVGASEAARSELHGSGIELSCVMPGVVNTELSSGLQPARASRTASRKT